MADDSKKHSCEAGDEIRLGPDLGNGHRQAIFHTADHQRSIGIVRPVREGEMLTGREFYAEPKDEAQGVYHYRPLSAEVQAAIQKPSKVVTPAYRAGWNAVFGDKNGPN